MAEDVHQKFRDRGVAFIPSTPTVMSIMEAFVAYLLHLHIHGTKVRTLERCIVVLSLFP